MSVQQWKAWSGRARSFAAWLLLACLLLPLSRCELTTITNGVEQKSIHEQIAYESLQSAMSTTAMPNLDQAEKIGLIFVTFFVPVLALLLNVRRRQLVHVTAAPIAAIYVFSQVYLFSTKVLFGGYVLMACWLYLFAEGLAAVVSRWRQRREESRLAQGIST